MSDILLTSTAAGESIGLSRKAFLQHAIQLGYDAADTQSNHHGGQPGKLWTQEQITGILAGVSLKSSLNERVERIKQLQTDVQKKIIAIGLELIAAKKELGHGGWADWLKDNFAWTQQTANNFMRVSERFGKLKNVVQFQPSTLQALLALPPGDENDFIAAQIQSGTPLETQSVREVKRNVKEWNRRKSQNNVPPPCDTANQSADDTNLKNVFQNPNTRPLPAADDDNVIDVHAQICAADKNFETRILEFVQTSTDEDFLKLLSSTIMKRQAQLADEKEELDN